ncbi:MAG: hypothetical protein HOP19_11325 [Acidobacteria bacterium]|nr:hypothetical protein [Acidobacteriota bacterium]
MTKKNHHIFSLTALIQASHQTFSNSLWAARIATSKSICLSARWRRYVPSHLATLRAACLECRFIFASSGKAYDCRLNSELPFSPLAKLYVVRFRVTYVVYSQQLTLAPHFRNITTMRGNLT